ncbi:DUF84 family protein [Candidatus Saccharibacteria bacterium]|nr:DUF84 family protein [Candidatus Saccharibacteria bacterium]MCB9821055.1 DUF84 family protein [Candidatus Nomurabacteria bacterium]
MLIVAGTRRSPKIEAVRLAAQDLELPNAAVVGCDVSSGVSDQPFGFNSTLEGAKNRSERALKANLTARIAVGMEGGLFLHEGQWFDVGIVVATDRQGRQVMAESERVEVPKSVIDLVIKDDVDLSTALGSVFGVDTVLTRDCTGYLTNGRLPVVELYRVAARSAMSLLNPKP